ncbi:MAG: 2-isopropylmalate synthase, partial [Peptostreptococcus porci]|nr:2-isopropylmalate synthase [Peptostreptococcus porci]
MKTIKIFDTTLRDGEQTPKVSMNIDDKVKIAKQLEKLGVDIIEAGFAFASEGDFEAVKKVAESVTKPIVCSLARAKKSDIERAAEAVKNAKHPRIHTFIATSDIHLENKLNMTQDECLNHAVEMVKYAKTF